MLVAHCRSEWTAQNPSRGGSGPAKRGTSTNRADRKAAHRPVLGPVPEDAVAPVRGLPATERPATRTSSAAPQPVSDGNPFLTGLLPDDLGERQGRSTAVSPSAGGTAGSSPTPRSPINRRGSNVAAVARGEACRQCGKVRLPFRVEWEGDVVCLCSHDLRFGLHRRQTPRNLGPTDCGCELECGWCKKTASALACGTCGAVGH